VGVMERIVIRLGQVERVIGGIVMDEVCAVTVVVVVIVVVVRVVMMIVVVLVVVVVVLEGDEVVRVLVIAARVRVRDDARAGHRGRGEEGHEDDLDDGGAQAHDAGVLPSGYGRREAGGCPRRDLCRAACHLL